MKRIGFPILIVALLLLLLVTSIFQAGVKDPLGQGQRVIEFVLSLLQIGSIILIVLFVTGYALFRPYRFVFKGFSNAGRLPSLDEQPLNLDILAREELVKQLKLMFYNPATYAGTGIDTHELLLHPPYTEHYSQQEDEHYSELDIDISTYKLSEKKDALFTLRKYLTLANLKTFIQSLEDQEGRNLISIVGENTPQQIAPLIKLLNEMIPPRTIEILGHLQWHSNATNPNHIGITFEFTGADKLHSLMPRTIWWHDSDDSADWSHLHTPKVTILATDRYIDLLIPAMHWLILTFWEYHLTLQIPFANRIFFPREKMRLAQIHYVLGALCYAYSEHNPIYQRFFWKLAVEYFQQSIEHAPYWSEPYLYLANLYTFSSQKLNEKDKKREELLAEAKNLFDKGIHHITLAEARLQLPSLIPLPIPLLDKYEKRINKLRYERYRLMVDKALAQFIYVSDDEAVSIFSTLGEDLPELKDEQPDLEKVDPNYLYDLACLCEFFIEKRLTSELKKQNLKLGTRLREKAHTFLESSLRRSPDLWKLAKQNPDFQRHLDLEALEKERNGDDARISQMRRTEQESSQRRVSKILT